jgi:hypothetical protein
MESGMARRSQVDENGRIIIRKSHLSFIQVLVAIVIGCASFFITSATKVGSAIIRMDDRYVTKSALAENSRQHEIDITRIERMIRDQNEKIDAVYQFLITGKGRAPHGSRSDQ